MEKLSLLDPIMIKETWDKLLEELLNEGQEKLIHDYITKIAI